jgi:hypothetical protein
MASPWYPLLSGVDFKQQNAYQHLQKQHHSFSGIISKETGIDASLHVHFPLS